MRVLLFVAGTILFLIAVIYFMAWRSPPTYTLPETAERDYPLMSWEEYTEHARSVKVPYTLKIDPLNKGAAVFLGVEHRNDKNHPQNALIQKEWVEFQPGVALIEGRLGFLLPGVMDPVSTYGESGQVAALAKEAGAELYSWELSKEDEIRRLRKKHSAEEVAMFIILRPYFSQVTNKRPLDVDQKIRSLIEDRGRREGIEGIITSVDDIDRIWERDFPDEANWRDYSFGPSLPGYMGDLFEEANNIRDHHLLAIVDDLTANGQRVFVTAGWSHIVRIEPVFMASDNQ